MNVPPNVTAKLAEAEKSLLSIRQARDAVVAQARELAAKLENAEERIAGLTEQNEYAVQAAEAAETSERASRTEREELRRKCEELRRNLRVFNEQRVTAQETEGQISADLEDARQKVAALVQERDLLRVLLDEQRDKHFQESEAAAARQEESEMKLEEMRKDVELLVSRQKKKLAESNARVESANRTRDAAVANVIQAQCQVKLLKGELDTARKQLSEERTILEARIIAFQSQAALPPVSIEPASAPAAEAKPEAVDKIAAPAATAPAPPPKPIAPAVMPFVDGEAAHLVAGLAADIEVIRKDQYNPALLEKLEADLQAFDKRARVSGPIALHRAGVACGEVLRWLHKSPAKIHGALPCLAEMIAVLKDLASLPPGSSSVADTAGATIFAVDDDVDNCECISMAMEKLEYHTIYSVTSELALAQLEATNADLIILDVDMPHMDGFELYLRLRASDRHMDTPVLFLSGLISAKERMEELPPGHHDFLAKPYNLTVLGAKTTEMILRSRLANSRHALSSEEEVAA